MKTKGIWKFKLFTTPNSKAKSDVAFSNIKAICKERFIECCIDVIDLEILPKLAKENQIVALPTLLRTDPLPPVKLVGDLTNREKVLLALKLKSG